MPETETEHLGGEQHLSTNANSMRVLETFQTKVAIGNSAHLLLLKMSCKLSIREENFKVNKFKLSQPTAALHDHNTMASMTL